MGGAYNDEMVTFNVYVGSPGIVVFDATNSYGEWGEKHLEGIEVDPPNDPIISDGDQGDLYTDDFLVLGVNVPESGIYVLYFWVGDNIGQQPYAQGWYDISISCIASDVSSLSSAGSVPVNLAESGVWDSASLTSWFSLQTVYGHLVMSTSTKVLMIFWLLSVVICSVTAALCMSCIGNKRVSYVKDADFADYVE